MREKKDGRQKRREKNKVIVFYLARVIYVLKIVLKP